ncbi:MAG: sigma-70 family RNA polymerase sigma factor [Duncaniella sp.]|nr:sigma-70 family RNA polymerase sigma factor [Duncaniella sp.]
MVYTSDYNTAYSAMIKRHEKIIFSVCFFYATTATPFEDLRQEVLISLFKAYRHFRLESAESTWVYKVCINTCLFSLRKFSPKVKTVSLDELPVARLQESTDNDFKRRLEWLHRAISTLGPMDKAIILMWLDELSYEEIAANTGIPRNTVATRLHRIRKRLSSNKENI